MRKGKIVALFLVVALVLSMLLACAGPAEPAEGEMTDIKLVSSAVGSGTYVNIVVISAMVAANSEWLRATPIPTPGWLDSLRLLGTGRADIAGTGGIQINHMMKGTAYFEGEQYTNLLLMWPFMFPPVTVSTTVGSPFKTMQDIKDSVCAISLPGSAGETDARAIFEGLGWEPKKIINMAYVDMPSALKDGTVDVVIHSYSLGSPGMVEHTTVNDCYFIPMDDDTWSKVEGLGIGYVRIPMPGGTYRLQDEDVPVMAKGGYFVSTDRTSEEIIYEVARCFWDDIEKTTKLNPKVIGDCIKTVETTLNVPGPAPMHPGAIKYFTEKGMLK